MLAASQALAALAVLSVGVIYGTDIFSAVDLRNSTPVLILPPSGEPLRMPKWGRFSGLAANLLPNSC
jgi:hypothetical protein